MELTVQFDGHAINGLFTVEKVDRNAIAPIDIESVTIPGRNGVMFTGSRLGASEVTITMAAFGDTYADVLEKMRTLGGWLVVDGPKKLEFGDEGGLWRMAAPSGQASIARIGNNAARVSVSFVIPDACKFGEGGTADSSGGSLTIEVDGTLPTPALITSSAASGTFTLLDEDSGRKITVAIGSVAQQLVIDCGARTCMVGDAAKMITLASDWFVLEPGQHRIRRTGGAGEFSIQYESRWA